MTTFDDREKAFENRFVHDQALEFRAEARRNRVLAHWAGGLLGKNSAGQEDYAAEILAAAIKGGDEAVLVKLVGDLAGASVPVPEQQVRHRMELELTEALRNLKAP